MTVQSRYQSFPQQQQYRHETQHDIIATGSIWMSGSGTRRPTLYLPRQVLSRYSLLNQPCEVTFEETQNHDGIIIRYLHDKKNKKQKTKNNNSNGEEMTLL